MGSSWPGEEGLCLARGSACAEVWSLGRDWCVWELQEMPHSWSMCVSDGVVRGEGQSGQSPMRRVEEWV